MKGDRIVDKIVTLLGELKLGKQAITQAEKICTRLLEPGLADPIPPEAVLNLCRAVADRCEVVTGAALEVADAIQPRLIKPAPRTWRSSRSPRKKRETPDPRDLAILGGDPSL